MSLTLRPLLFQVHSYLAVSIALYVAILGITGAIMAFETEIDRLTHASLAYVTPTPMRLSLVQIGDVVAKAYPGQKFTTYTIGEASNLSTVVGTGSMNVYVNPYTGQVLGSRAFGLTRASGLTVLGFIHSFHQRLTAPRPGHAAYTQAFVAWISVAALFLVASGIWLWWPLMRFGIGAGGGRPFWYDVHATLGITAAAFLILLAFTGIIAGFATAPMFYAVTGSQPTPQPKVPPPPADGTQPIAVDRALAIAADALPGATPVRITGPSPRGIYVVFARPSADHNPNVSLSQVTIDQYTGAVLAAETPDTAPGGARLGALIGAIHDGRVFGMPSKAIMALASLIIALQALTGVVMWIKRVPFRSMIPALVATAAMTGIAIWTIFAGV